MTTTTHAADDPKAAGRRLLLGIFRRQRRRVVIGAACWTSYQTCEVLVPVAIGIAVDAAVRPSDPTALVLSVVGIFAVFVTLTASWRTGAWVLAKGSLAEAHRLRSEAVRRILTGTGIATRRTSGELLSISTSDAKAAAEVLELGSRTVSAVLGLILSAFFLLRIDLAARTRHPPRRPAPRPRSERPEPVRPAPHRRPAGGGRSGRGDGG